MAIFSPILSIFLFFFFFNCMLKIKSSRDSHPRRSVWGSITSWVVWVPATPAAMALVKRGALERKRSREIKPFYTGNQLKWVKGLFLPRAPRPSGSDSIDAILKACHIHCVLKHLIICDSLQRGSLSSAVLGGVMCSQSSPEHHVEPVAAGWGIRDGQGLGGAWGPTQIYARGIQLMACRYAWVCTMFLHVQSSQLICICFENRLLWYLEISIQFCCKKKHS